MKKARYAMFSFIISFFFILSVNAKSNPYPHYEDLGFGKIVNCTWYAWDAAKSRKGIELPTWYNVWTWHIKAKKAGFATGKEPKKDSLMIWNYGDGFGGHVSYVTNVNGDTITYDEGGSMTSKSGVATNQTITLSEVKVLCEDYGFIYLDIPRSTSTKTTTTSRKTTTSTKEVVTSEKNSETTSVTTTEIENIISSSTTSTKSTKEITSTNLKDKVINNSKFSDVYGLAIFIISITILIIILSVIFKRKNRF